MGLIQHTMARVKRNEFMVEVYAAAEFIRRLNLPEDFVLTTI